MTDLAAPFEQELARRHLVDYLALVVPDYERARHEELVAEHLEAVERGEVKRLLIDAPPRHGKSLTVGQGFGSWFLGRNPRREVIVGSYAAELAESHSRVARGFMAGPAWPFPDVRVSGDSSAVARWHTNHSGGMRAVGVGGGITGHGADVLILDDLIKGRAEADSEAIREATFRWLMEDALTRLNPGGAVVAVGTRWHEDDPLGRLLDSAGAGEWTHLHLPALAKEDDLLGREVGEALWEARYPREHLHDVRVELGPRAFTALYQGAPTSAEGGTFKRDWLGGTYPAVPDGLRVVTACDASFGKGVGSDYSALVTVGTDGVSFYVLDSVRGRWEFGELVERIEAAADRWSPTAVLVEDAAAGQSAVQELNRSSALPVVAVKPEGSKIARAEAVSGLVEAGRVLFPAADPTWKGELIEELAGFPSAKHDDMTDALVYALERLRGGGSHGGVAGSVRRTREGTVTWRPGRDGQEPRRTVTPSTPGRRSRERARRAYVNPRLADD